MLTVSLRQSAVATCALFLVAVGAAQSYEGKYTGQKDIRLSDGRATLRYELELSRSGNATMLVSQSGAKDYSDRDLERYGFQLRELVGDYRFKQTGTWRREGDVCFVRFDRLVADQTKRVEAFVRFKVSGSRVSVTEMNEEFYGERSDISFKKSTGTSDNSNDSSGDYELVYRTGGRGTAQFGNGDKSILEEVDVKLTTKGRFRIRTKGSFPVELTGGYTKEGNSYSFSAEEIIVAGEKRPTTASGRIEMERGGKEARSIVLSGRVNGSRRSIEIRFTPAKG